MLAAVPSTASPRNGTALDGALSQHICVSDAVPAGHQRRLGPDSIVILPSVT